MASTEPEPRAVRLIFEYQGREVRMLSNEPVTAPAPPTDRLDGFDFPERGGQRGAGRGCDGAGPVPARPSGCVLTAKCAR